MNNGIKQEHEGESKKRIKKFDDSQRRDSTRPAEDPLDPSVVTKRVWDDACELFKLHCSTELPFLHMPTFKKRLRLMHMKQETRTSSISHEREWKILQLGVLTLTARFIPELVCHHGSLKNPLAASEYYATFLQASLFGAHGADLSKLSLERVQGFLMLGLHEWGHSLGVSAWLHIGNATRLAQVMALFHADGHKASESSTHSTSEETQLDKNTPPPDESVVLQREIRRRTVWSCFIMDRLLASGKNRISMLQATELNVQLPCSERQFLHIQEVETAFLEKSIQHGSVKSEDVLTKYIRLIDIFGRFSVWSHKGGRRTEGQIPPWENETTFYKLERELEEWAKALPTDLRWTQANLSAHIENRNSTTYATMHTLYALCLIMLHREYIPFIALRLRGKGPSGPLDQPIFPEEDFPAQKEFWHISAEKIFRAAHDILDIVQMCEENNALPESPEMGFALWQASYVGVYAFHYPWMDRSNHMTSSQWPTLKKMMQVMAPKLRMLDGYISILGRMDRLYIQVERQTLPDYKGKRIVYHGGGLTIYASEYEEELKDFNQLKDNRPISPSTRSENVDSVSRASTSELGASNGEVMQGVENTITSSGWAPVNKASAPNVELENRPKPPNPLLPPEQAPPRYIATYQQSASEPSNSPSLISANRQYPDLSSPNASAHTNQSFHNISRAPSMPQSMPLYPTTAYTAGPLPIMAPPIAPTQVYSAMYSAPQGTHAPRRSPYPIDLRVTFNGNDNFGQDINFFNWSNGEWERGDCGQYSPAETPSWMTALAAPQVGNWLDPQLPHPIAEMDGPVGGNMPVSVQMRQVSSLEEDEEEARKRAMRRAVMAG